MMNRLLDIGFQPAGHWRLVGDRLSFELARHGSQRNILYAFVCDGEVKYVGKTVQPLRARMQGYKSPDDSQVTNVRNNARLRELLSEGAALDILALPDNGLMHYGRFHLNLAAGLEDDIISTLRPVWNGRPRGEASEDVPNEASDPVPIDSFTITLHRTYFDRGFFNVPASHAGSFAGDGQEIEIFLGGSSDTLPAFVNRTANANGSPRIMGGIGLRDWFQSATPVMQQAAITIYSPTSIRINPVAA